MTTLVIATRNRHKVGEIRQILGPGFRYRDLSDFPGAPNVVEDAGTFSGNATKKAVELANWLAETNALSPKPSGEVLVVADDSGLEVDALGGAPGVHSARYAALDSGKPGNSLTAENNSKLLRALKGVPAEGRTARFRCVIAVTPVLPTATITASPTCSADGHELQVQLFEGVCEGQIELAPRGSCGFGYDPLFRPKGFTQTFGELDEETKNRLSHRSKALLQLQRCRLGE